MKSFLRAAALYAFIASAAAAAALATGLPPLNDAIDSNGEIQEKMAGLPTGIVSHPLVPHHVEHRRRQRARARGLDAIDASQALDDNLDSANLGDADHPRRRLGGAKQVGALYQGYGTHYVDVWCGTPPQRQTVIVSTNSGATGFPCKGCENCGAPDYHIDKLFDPDQSTSFHIQDCTVDGCTNERASCGAYQHCELSQFYAEGSGWKAYEVKDHCYIGGSHVIPLVDDHGSDDLDPSHASNFAFDMVFGCQFEITGLFRTQLADGILGMGNSVASYWHQMFISGHMGQKEQFALCFSRQPTANREGTEAGAMTLGGVDPRLHHDDMVYTPNRNAGRRGSFSVKVRRIHLRDGKAGESARSKHEDQTEGVLRLNLSEYDINRHGVILDSGTTDTYWNHFIAAEFELKFRELTGQDYPRHGVRLTQEELEALPTILFQLEGDNFGADPKKTLGLAGDLDPQYPTDVILAFPPSHYMEYKKQSRQYIPRFSPTESGGSVMGANVMMGHDVFFDINGGRLGFAESDCDFSKILEQNGFTSVFDSSVDKPANPTQGDDSASPSAVSHSCGGTCRGSIVGAVILLPFLVVWIFKTVRHGRDAPVQLHPQNAALVDEFAYSAIELPDSGFQDEVVGEASTSPDAAGHTGS